MHHTIHHVMRNRGIVEYRWKDCATQFSVSIPYHPQINSRSNSNHFFSSGSTFADEDRRLSLGIAVSGNLQSKVGVAVRDHSYHRESHIRSRRLLNIIYNLARILSTPTNIGYVTQRIPTCCIIDYRYNFTIRKAKVLENRDILAVVQFAGNIHIYCPWNRSVT